MPKLETKMTANHWGAGVAVVRDGQIQSVNGHPDDPDPSPINENIAGSLHGDARVMRPAVRRSWLENGPKGRGTAGQIARGREGFIEVSWEIALDLVAKELTRVRTAHGNGSIFAGSYGWSSAGRFHHAQSQLKRFLNTQGGFVRSEGNYSYNAALVLMPHIVGPYRQHVVEATRWPVIAKHSELVVCFGGMAQRNTQVSDGGVAKHRMKDHLALCKEAGVDFINLSPLRSDILQTLDATWMALLPGSDTALMMGLAHTLLVENLYDASFLEKYTVGFEQIEAYLLGNGDGQVKDVEWAASQTGLKADEIRSLARRMASSRTMISIAAGVQRTDFGEQPLWMGVTLAAMLGQIGLPGGGYVIGYGVNANIGNVERPFRWGSLSQLKNAQDDFIPVAMITEMLMKPGGAYEYNGSRRVFPDARMVWWAGGNPFHHHQDLNKLHAAFQTPETVIVNEMNWTATARHADIVLPVASAQERTDFGAGKSDNALVPMPAVIEPVGEARTEYDIFADLAALLGDAHLFTEGRSSDEWLEHIWQQTQTAASGVDVNLPDWDGFLAGEIVHLPDPTPEQVFLADFRGDPQANPLPTPSGLIELFSQKIASFNLTDCFGHPTWIPPRDVAAGEQRKHPLYMLSGQPKTRLHSQLDNGAYSQSHKVKGREPVLMNPADADARGVVSGDVVELFNDRGRCLAGAKVTDEIREGCIFLWTGAWFDPDFDAPQNRDRHGNPNALTHDYRTSSLAQGPAAHSTLIELRKFEGALPEIKAHAAPNFLFRAEPDTTD